MTPAAGPQARARSADGVIMAGARRLEQDLRRARRWIDTTPRARGTVELLGAALMAGVVVALLAVSADIGWWALVIAALPVANQIRVQIEAGDRRRAGGGPDLASGSLADADLAEADLVAVDLRGVTVTGTRFGKADLRYGRLVGADCREASFYQATMFEADLRRVEARNANFERADLRHVRFDGANLLGARFRGADLRGADLTGAKLAADALAGAVVDGTTVLVDGSPGDPIRESAMARAWSTVGVVGAGVALGVARPALHGLAWAAIASGVVMAALSSGDGLGQELAIVTRSAPTLDELQPRAKPRLPATASSNSSTDGAAGDVVRGGGGSSTPADLGELVDPESIDGDGQATGSSPAAAGSGSGSGDPSADEDGAPGDRPDPAPPTEDTGGAAASAAGTGPEAGRSSTSTTPDEPTSDRTEPRPADGTETAAPPETRSGTETDRSGDDGPLELTEAERPDPAGRSVVRQIRIVVASDGGPATVTAASSLGQLEPRTIDGPDGWELGLPSGEIRVQVVPSDGEVSTACQIQVDGVERSFQSSLAGQISTCLVDLDPVGG